MKIANARVKGRVREYHRTFMGKCPNTSIEPNITNKMLKNHPKFWALNLVITHNFLF